MKSHPTPPPASQTRSFAKIEVCILAGGLSSRMGSDKSKLRLNGKTLLSHIGKRAKSLKLPVRIIKRDQVQRCGPLGGIYTALKTSKADAILFLACDMPSVSEPLLQKLLKFFGSKNSPAFSWNKTRFGFPFMLGRDVLPEVERLILEKKFSLQTLAEQVGARKFRPGREFRSDFRNVNTPEDWAELKNISSEKN